ncbi:hypothetical protein [Legionella shakespearei]|uniref:Coiled coil protein n=1 Tax=Legionella shakespearei DSM 23087 TaxID=1122169 RepID=A0A0W0YHL0_9GAMM|nr:hypothetical protein [Legionella shakespearei]KTD56442.1 hypothetical protein Lsha_2841 [Legionella shakespearei DSM 23087]
MNDRTGKRSLQALKQTQLELNRQIAMLQEESRRLRDEIEKAQVTKDSLFINGQRISATRVRIGTLQKNIQAELNKLTLVNPASVSESDVSSMAPPPPPASPPLSPPFVAKMGALKSGKSKGTLPEKRADAKGDLLKEISVGKKLKSDNDRTAQKSEQDESALYDSSIHLKENEVKRLVEQVNDLLDALETEKAIAQEYAEELEKQSELILELQEIEVSLEEEFTKVQEEVGIELALLEEQKASVKREQLAEHEALVKKEAVQSAEFADPPSAPPPPPTQAPPAPTFAPVSNSFKLKVKAVKAETPQVLDNAPKTPAGRQGTIDTGEVASIAQESQKRREALEIRNYLAEKLIELVAEESVAEEDEMDYSSEQQKLISILGDAEYQRLKTEMVQSLDDQMSDMEKGAAQRRAALNRTPKELALIAGLKDKSRLLGRVLAFIDEIVGKTNLLATGKGMKQAEETQAQKVFEKQQQEEAQKKEQRDKELEAAQKIKAEEKAAFVKSELLKLGIKEGTVNTEAIKKAAAEKAVQAQTGGGLGVNDVAAFLESVDKDLSTKIELFRAAALQAMESAAMQPPEGEAPPVPEEELPIIEPADKNPPVAETHTESMQHAVLDFDEIERDLNELDQRLAQDVSRQLEQDLSEIEQGLREIDQQLAQEDNRQLEQDLSEIEQGLREIEQQLAKPQSKPVQRAEQKLSHLVTSQRKESNSRRDLLEKSDFDTHLGAIKKAAEHFANNKQPLAAKETNILHGKLLQARDAFIKTGDVDKFILTSNKALAVHETRYLAQNEGIFTLLKRTVKSLQGCVKIIASKPNDETQTKKVQIQNNENQEPNAAAKGKEIPAIRAMKKALRELQDVNTTDAPEDRNDLHI